MNPTRSVTATAVPSPATPAPAQPGQPASRPVAKNAIAGQPTSPVDVLEKPRAKAEASARDPLPTNRDFVISDLQGRATAWEPVWSSSPTHGLHWRDLALTSFEPDWGEIGIFAGGDRGREIDVTVELHGWTRNQHHAQFNAYFDGCLNKASSFQANGDLKDGIASSTTTRSGTKYDMSYRDGVLTLTKTSNGAGFIGRRLGQHVVETVELKMRVDPDLKTVHSAEITETHAPATFSLAGLKIRHPFRKTAVLTAATASDIRSDS